MTDHMTSIDSTLAAASGLLSKWLPQQRIDLQPVGTPTVMHPPTSRVKGRGGGGVLKTVSRIGVRAELAGVHARYLLATKQPAQAQQILSDALAEVGSTNEIRGHRDCFTFAWLHHCVGVAMAQQLEGEEAWFSSSQGRGADMLGQCIEEFLLCYQLCYPATPTNLLRETCLWLGLLLGCPDHAHHFQALSQHTTLAHQTVLSLGKKLR